MVSFQCESCGDVLTKKKLDPHRNRCRGASFSCIDCMVHFYGTEYRAHTSCMTEDQKYQGALYKNNKNKKVKLNPPPNHQEAESHNFQDSTSTALTTTTTTTTTAATPRNKKPNMAAAVQQQQHVSHAAYIEDVPEELEEFLVADDDDSSSRSDDDAPPHAPTPPPAPEGPVNVFDFLVAGPTPNASNIDLPHGAGGPVKLSDSTQVVRYQQDVNAYLENPDLSMDNDAQRYLVQYGEGPVPVRAPFQTPAPGDRMERRKKESAELKKDKKRKRLTLDLHDQVMTDAPPVLHSGLTGGLNRLTTKNAVFPPSPESAETPASPLKKTKHSKHSKASRADTIGNNLFSMLAAGSKPKTKKRKHRSVSPSGKKHRHRHSRHRAEAEKAADPKAPKLIEYPSADKDKEDGDNNEGQMIVYKPRADLFLSFVNKGPESERGCSMNKALKRFHRERTSSGTALGKTVEEKELFRSLRLRKNDRGEIVLFCISD